MQAPIVYDDNGVAGVQRSLAAIFTDLSALTTQQQSALWTDLSSRPGGAGTPMKYQLDQGTCASGIAALDWILSDSGAGATAISHARLRVAACYVQDNVRYLDGVTLGGQTFNVLGFTPLS